MPYNKPQKSGSGWVLPKKSGGAHRDASGHVVHFSSKEKAENAGRMIMAKEHGFKPTRRR